MVHVFDSVILGKYDVNYYACKNCGFLSTESPYWLEESYASPINLTDTGILGRNIYLSKIVSILLSVCFNHNSKFLDYGAGYGILVRLLRDVGFDFYWSDAYAQNVFAKGFESTAGESYALTLSFETFEHFPDPIYEIDRMFGLSKNLLFSVELFDDASIPDANVWWYYGREHGQHISFYTLRTLRFIASKYNKVLYTNNKDIHMFSDEPSWKIYVSFKLFGASFLSRMTRELLFLILKAFNKGRAFDDMLYLKNKINI